MWPLRLAILIVALVLALLAAAAVGSVLPDSLNPFREKTVDRTGPALLRSIDDIGEYRAATANMQVVVDVEKDSGILPDLIKGERTILVAAGTVDAGVDLGALAAGDVVLDGRAVTIRLPHARLYEAQVDLGRSYVVDRQRGLVDRVADAIGDGPPEDSETYVVAETKLGEAARKDPTLLATAERNTRAMLTTLVTSLGYPAPTITFATA